MAVADTALQNTDPADKTSTVAPVDITVDVPASADVTTVNNTSYQPVVGIPSGNDPIDNVNPDATADGSSFQNTILPDPGEFTTAQQLTNGLWTPEKPAYPNLRAECSRATDTASVIMAAVLAAMNAPSNGTTCASAGDIATATSEMTAALSGDRWTFMTIAQSWVPFA